MQIQTTDERNPNPMTLSPDPTKGDPLRNVGRVVMKVIVAEGGGARSVAGRLLSPGSHWIEVYADQVEGVEAQVRTESDVRIFDAAKRASESKKADWIANRIGDIREDGTLTETQRALLIERAERECPVHWAQFLEDAAKYEGLDKAGIKRSRTGLKALTHASIVRELEAPDTPENISRKTSDAHATAIANAFELMAKRTGLIAGPTADVIGDDDDDGNAVMIPSGPRRNKRRR